MRFNFLFKERLWWLSAFCLDPAKNWTHTTQMLIKAEKLQTSKELHKKKIVHNQYTYAVGYHGPNQTVLATSAKSHIPTASSVLLTLSNTAHSTTWYCQSIFCLHMSDKIPTTDIFHEYARWPSDSASPISKWRAFTSCSSYNIFFFSHKTQ